MGSSRSRSNAGTPIILLLTRLGTRVVHRPSINIRSKGQKSRSQGQKMQQGDQVTGEVMQSIECPASMACLYYTHHLRRN